MCAPITLNEICKNIIADSSKTLFILAMNKVFFFFMALKAHIFFFPISIFFRSERGRNGKKKGSFLYFFFFIFFFGKGVESRCQ